VTDGPAAREPDSRPRLTIVSGQPTPEETAAVAVVLTALLSQPAPEARPVPSQWSARPRFLRAPVTPGPGAWRASALPR
jgi:hypothetical protein